MLRCDFIDEEAAELRLAVQRGDVTGVADALGDLAYVVYGAALYYGIDLDAVVAEVHRYNMTKTQAGNGKVDKGPGYRPPNLREVLASNGPETSTHPSPSANPDDG